MPTSTFQLPTSNFHLPPSNFQLPPSTPTSNFDLPITSYKRFTSSRTRVTNAKASGLVGQGRRRGLKNKPHPDTRDSRIKRRGKITQS